ncbi:hypothetical protein ACLOJK_016677 [Asimina triloba]
MPAQLFALNVEIALEMGKGNLAVVRYPADLLLRLGFIVPGLRFRMRGLIASGGFLHAEPRLSAIFNFYPSPFSFEVSRVRCARGAGAFMSTLELPPSHPSKRAECGDAQPTPEVRHENTLVLPLDVAQIIWFG